MTAAWGNSTDRMLAALAELGRATRAQLQSHAGIDKNTAGQVVARITQVAKRGPMTGQRRAYVCDWTREHDGARDYLRPVYALGNKPDKPRPPPKCMKQVKREYRARRRQRIERFSPGAALSAAWHQPPTTTTP